MARPSDGISEVLWTHTIHNVERKRSCSHPVEQNLTDIPRPIVPFGLARSRPEQAVKLFHAARHTRH